ncbi:MAG: type II toxin-antitoxin system HigB family toxin [Gammaproteobacteria bacterium]|nr:type II toxin-antitoxin system HigB family toxin [Gammaproteobacteria bacterium]MXY52260.1 type II toxin-antitoxin system HigB family toxin [Gammaproteobacteria bacterium]
MRIIAKRTLRSYWEENPDAEQPLKSWYAIASEANWTTPHEVRATYGNASIVGQDRVVFNIGGNKRRLIVRFDYPRGLGFIRFVGTHGEYDKIDASKV